jgi:ATP-binding cassette subfamily B protein
MKPAFEAQKINTDEIVYALHTDMDKQGAHADVYTAVTLGKLYILQGEELVSPVKGAKRLVAGFAAQSLSVYNIADITDLETERLVATGILSAAINGEREALIMFSVGYLSDIEQLSQVIKNVQNKNEPLAELTVDADKFCPKCGVRYPEIDRKVCPNCIDTRSVSLRLMGFFQSYWKRVLLIILIMLTMSAFSVFTPYLTSQRLYDDVLTEGGGLYGLLAQTVGIILLVRSITVLLNMLYSFMLAKTVPWIVFDLKMKIFKAMQSLSVGFYTSKRTGALMNRINRDATNIYWFFVDGLPYLIVNVLTFSGVLAVMLLNSVKLALVVIIILPVALLMFRMLWNVFKRFHHKNFVYGSQLNSMVSDSVNGQRVIKAYAREGAEADRFAVVGNKQAHVDISANKVAFTAFPLIYLFMFLGQVVISFIGGVMVVNHEITIGTYLAFQAYISMLYGPLEFLSWVSNWWARCVDSAQRVFEVIDAKPDIAEPEHPADVDEMHGDIEVRGVRFEYDPATPVLKGLDISVGAGKMLGVVGKTGAGKSTLANLIARLYDVGEGEIKIDGINVKEWPLKKLRSEIGIVSQDIYLFIGSIADNIKYAKPDATMDDVIRAAKAAAAHDFIMKLPDGYETRIGSGGQDVSGGEKQRLSIARTILQNPRILILDEATAAMDTETEAAIQKALTELQKNRTTIAIAHRLSTLRDADSLAVIEEGKVVEKGTHAELMRKQGAYHKLYKLQMEGLKVINMDADIA